MAGKVLVTGGAGFIGSHLVDRLRTDGADVRVVDNLDPQAHGENAKVPDYLEGVDFLQLDVADSSIWEQALKDVTHVVHFASAVGLAQSLYEIEYYTRTNVMGTASLLQALADQDKKIDRLVVASSMSCYGEGFFECPNCHFRGTNLRNNGDLDKERWEVPCPKCDADLRPLPTPEEKNFQPQFVYSINKRDQEELCLAVGKAYDIETVALRFFSAYGPRQALSNPYTGVAAIFASRLLGEKPPLIFEDGQQTRDFIHVSDVVSSTVQALYKEDVGFQALNVGSGHAVTIEQVARVLQKRLGGPDPEFPNTYRKGDIRHCFPDISRAKEALDWEPKHQLEDGVEDLVEWVASQVSHADALDAHVEELRKKGLLGTGK